MVIERSGIRWEIREVFPVFGELKQKHGEAWYEAQKQALQQTLCDYFSTDLGCMSKSNLIVPHGGASEAGGKGLKIRWGLPGTGKSGGLRILAVVYCEMRRVYLVAAELRKDNPRFEDRVRDHEP